jgi:hypothetical protein
LQAINEFNTVFQAESPLLYSLKDKVFELIQDFASNFIDVTYLRETNPLEIDPSLEEYYIPEENIYLGSLILNSTLNPFNLLRRNICRNSSRRNLEGSRHDG